MCVALSSSRPAFQSADEAATTMAYVIFDADYRSHIGVLMTPGSAAP
jgi:hypothetical protein